MNGRYRQRAWILNNKVCGLFVLLMHLAVAAAVASDRNEPIENRIGRVENGLLPSALSGTVPAPPWNIRERMQHYQVSGVSIAVIHNFQVEWARGYGVLEAGSATPVDAETLFQAASLSKPVTAMGLLSLVQKGMLALDEPANQKLSSWRIPDNSYTAVNQVTVRHLLSHTAGTTSFGYYGYNDDLPLPNVVQILDGQWPANSPPIRVELVPGSSFRYSNGGYVILQQMAMDLTRMPFEQWMQTEVLNKLEMSRSTFGQPLADALARNAASGHFAGGEAIRGKWMTYPEQAAAGLWSTPSDVARFVIELQKSYTGNSNRVLSKALVRQMLTVQAANYGLGIEVQSGGALMYHTGANTGYRNIFLGYPHTGEGAVVMTNSDAGGELRWEILRAIAAEYGWPHLRVAGIPAAAPTLGAGNSTVNSASSQPAIAPDSIASIYGPDLAGVTEVVMNGLPARILFVSANQINVVVPANLEPDLALLQVKREGIASAGREVRIERFSPGLYSLNQRGDGPGIIAHADTFRLVSEAEPARRGEYLSVLCTGLGPGITEPAVTVGGMAARVLWSGPMPGFPGVNQVNIQVPADAPRGVDVTVTLQIDGAMSNSVTVVIE